MEPGGCKLFATDLLSGAILQALTMSDSKHSITSPSPPVAPTRAVAYVRMSTEHQQYSTYNQMVAIQAYATLHSMEIVRVYADEGISGLRAENRANLQKLMSEVLSGSADYSVVLVYDVSRWGRFQDMDQGAHYEYSCRQHGVRVIYCAEPFQDDNSPLSAVVKAVKRAMAAEYSRELSVKVFQGLSNLAKRGFDQGGGPPYGLKHLIVDAKGIKTGEVPPRMQKAIKTDHVMLAPGPPAEIKVVREIFRRCVHLNENTGWIARSLNQQGVVTRSGKPWRASHIASILRNEKYIGTQIYNRTSAKLGAKRVWNDPSQWIRKPNAFRGIISPDLFYRAQDVRRKQVTKPSDEELLSKLRWFIAKKGGVTIKQLRRYKSVPNPSIYCWRFGRISEAYRLIGYQAGSYLKVWSERARRTSLRHEVLDKLRQHVEFQGETFRANTSGAQFWVGYRLYCVFYLARRYTDVSYGERWCFRIREAPRTADLYIVGRLAADDRSIMDYFVIPNAAMPAFPTSIRRRARREVERFRVPKLSAVIKMLRPPNGNIATGR